MRCQKVPTSFHRTRTQNQRMDSRALVDVKSGWLPMEGLCHYLCGNLDVLVRTGAGWNLSFFLAAQHTKQHPFANSFNPVLTFRLTMTPLPPYYPKAFLLLIPKSQKLFSSPPISPSLIPPLAHQLSFDSALQGRHSPGLTHSAPFLHRHPLTTDHKGPD